MCVCTCMWKQMDCYKITLHVHFCLCSSFARWTRLWYLHWIVWTLRTVCGASTGVRRGWIFVSVWQTTLWSYSADKCHINVAMDDAVAAQSRIVSSTKSFWNCYLPGVSHAQSRQLFTIRSYGIGSFWRVLHQKRLPVVRFTRDEQQFDNDSWTTQHPC